jgi:hypothetical protein
MESEERYLTLLHHLVEFDQRPYEPSEVTVEDNLYYESYHVASLLRGKNSKPCSLSLSRAGQWSALEYIRLLEREFGIGDRA